MTAPTARAAHGPERTELDEVTLRRAQAGAAQACRALVEHYGARVLALATRMMAGDRAAAEDVVQDTFLHVFRSLAQFSPLGPARLSTWILTIATRRAIDELRRRPPASAAFDVEAALGPADVEQTVRERELAAAVVRAVAEMAPEYRAAFLLRELHDLEYAEIARALDLDLGTVKSRLARGRAVLRRHLAGALP